MQIYLAGFEHGTSHCEGIHLLPPVRIDFGSQKGTILLVGKLPKKRGFRRFDCGDISYLRGKPKRVSRCKINRGGEVAAYIELPRNRLRMRLSARSYWIVTGDWRSLNVSGSRNGPDAGISEALEAELEPARGSVTVDGSVTEKGNE